MECFSSPPTPTHTPFLTLVPLVGPDKNKSFPQITVPSPVAPETESHSELNLSHYVNHKQFGKLPPELLIYCSTPGATSLNCVKKQIPNDILNLPDHVRTSSILWLPWLLQKNKKTTTPPEKKRVKFPSLNLPKYLPSAPWRGCFL